MDPAGEDGKQEVFTSQEAVSTPRVEEIILIYIR